MARAPLTTTLASPHRYDSVDRYEHTADYRDLLRELLEEPWTLSTFDVWLKATPPDYQRELRQGFKIHVSSVRGDAERTLRAVVPVLAAAGVSFKTAGDPTIHKMLNARMYTRGKSGKFITVYPNSQEQFETLIEAVYQATEGLDLKGPYILSDRRYKDSRTVHYRYGGFRPPRVLNADGTTSTVLVGPDGSTHPDERAPFFTLPPWVQDPFPAEQTEDDPEGDIVLNDRYRVLGVLDITNSGGVYDAVDTTTGAAVVIKEARPFTQYWQTEGGYRDAVDLLEREYEMLEHLSDVPSVVNPIEFFREWEHSFLVMHRVEASTYGSFWALPGHIVAPFIRRPERLKAWTRTFADVSVRLLDAVQSVHDVGVTLGDLSPGNVLVNVATHEVTLIDVESAVRARDQEDFLDFSKRYATAGFIRPGRGDTGSVGVRDDLYALGMMLMRAFVPVTSFFQLNPSARDAFLDRFVALGIPAPVRDTVRALQEGSVERARRALVPWATGVLARAEPTQAFAALAT